MCARPGGGDRVRGFAKITPVSVCSVFAPSWLEASVVLYGDTTGCGGLGTLSPPRERTGGKKVPARAVAHHPLAPLKRLCTTRPNTGTQGVQTRHRRNRLWKRRKAQWSTCWCYVLPGQARSCWASCCMSLPKQLGKWNPSTGRSPPQPLSPNSRLSTFEMLSVFIPLEPTAVSPFNRGVYKELP